MNKQLSFLAVDYINIDRYSSKFFMTLDGHEKVPNF